MCVNIQTTIKFEIWPPHCDVLIGPVNFATISFQKDDMMFIVKFGDDFADFRFPPEEAAKSIAAIFGLDTEAAAQIAAAISGIQRC